MSAGVGPEQRCAVRETVGCGDHNARTDQRCSADEDAVVRHADIGVRVVWRAADDRAGRPAEAEQDGEAGDNQKDESQTHQAPLSQLVSDSLLGTCATARSKCKKRLRESRDGLRNPVQRVAVSFYPRGTSGGDPTSSCCDAKSPRTRGCDRAWRADPRRLPNGRIAASACRSPPRSVVWPERRTNVDLAMSPEDGFQLLG